MPTLLQLTNAFHVVSAESKALRSYVSGVLDHNILMLSTEAMLLPSVVIGFCSTEAELFDWASRHYLSTQSVGRESMAKLLICRSAQGGCLLCLVASHMILDGQSLQIFWQKLAAALDQASREKLQPAFTTEDGEYSVIASFSLDSSHESEQEGLSPRELTYWLWVADKLAEIQAKGKIAIKSAKATSFFNINSDDYFWKYFHADYSNSHTTYENFVAAIAILLQRLKSISNIVIEMPVSLRLFGNRDVLGFFVDSRPMLLELDNVASRNDLCRQIRNIIKRSTSLPYPWRDCVYARTGKKLPLPAMYGSLLVSQFTNRSDLKYKGFSATPISEYELSGLTCVRSRRGAARRSVTDFQYKCSFQLEENRLAILTNIPELAMILSPRVQL